MKALVLVFGDVHGVGFRAYCKRLAQQLGLNGLCRNEPGSVKVFLDGAEKSVEKFVETVKNIKQSGFFGPQVENVEVFREGEKGFEPEWRSYVWFEIDFS
mgnify:CR=1 FL=1